MMKYHVQNKANWEERVYLVFTLRLQFSIEGSRGRNLEAGADAEAMEGAAY